MLFGHDEGKNLKQLCNGEKDVICIAMGGTGADNAADARKNLGLGAAAVEDIVPIAKGGTGKTTKAEALAALGVKDYIIEQDTSGIWEYEKWASGKAVCRACITHVTSTFVAWGSLYEGSPVISNQAFPSDLFIDNDIYFNADATGSNAISGLEQVGVVTATQTPKLYLLRGASGGAITTYVSIEAIGKWK